ncbi:tRNA lysidine(34) synthetase TilS [Bartonella sp. B35(2025)]
MLIRLAENLFKTSDFIQCQKLILAVSGGSDSLALLFLVRDYLKTLSAPPEAIVVTVDHQLRKESAHEAENVAEICRYHQMKHIIVRWEGQKPKTHVAEKARIARYDLLFKEAQKQGATLIMTGHTLNDQVETYQMRSQRVLKSVGALQQEISEGISDRVCTTAIATDILEKSWGLMYARGLSCIPREALLRRTVRLIRPLLGVKRKTLRAYLRLQGKTWIDDPTNEDLNFERVRIRQSLHQKKLTDIAKKINEATLKRRQQAQNLADLILALDIIVEHGRCFIGKPAPFLQRHPGFFFIVGLFAVLMGGGFYLLPYKKLIALDKKLCLNSPGKQRFTLAGSVIECSQKGVAFWRESRNIREVAVDPGKTILWDGRYQITNYGSDTIKIRAANLEYLKFLFKNGICDPEHPHFPSLQSLLMISNNKGTDIPELTYQAIFQQNVVIKRIMAPFEWLLSREDAALVNVIEPFFNIDVKR